jgi:hypothetical protein
MERAKLATWIASCFQFGENVSSSLRKHFRSPSTAQDERRAIYIIEIFFVHAEALEAFRKLFLHPL